MAASPLKTAVAVIEWSDTRARLSDLVMHAADAHIRESAAGADRVGIDAPFGWPEAFVRFVSRHHDDATEPGGTLDDVVARRPLVYRRTDLYVARLTGRHPLSVSADKIAHVALRCAGLLGDLDERDRVRGRMVEAYPAAALSTWGIRSRGYKGVANEPVRASMVTDLRSAAPWLDLGEHVEQMVAVDDSFDAVITALIARAADLGRTHAPPPDESAVAVREGWIHVPDCGLAELIR